MKNCKAFSVATKHDYQNGVCANCGASKPGRKKNGKKTEPVVDAPEVTYNREATTDSEMIVSTAEAPATVLSEVEQLAGEAGVPLTEAVEAVLADAPADEEARMEAEGCPNDPEADPVTEPTPARSIEEVTAEINEVLARKAAEAKAEPSISEGRKAMLAELVAAIRADKKIGRAAADCTLNQISDEDLAAELHKVLGKRSCSPQSAITYYKAQLKKNANVTAAA